MIRGHNDQNRAKKRGTDLSQKSSSQHSMSAFVCSRYLRSPVWRIDSAKPTNEMVRRLIPDTDLPLKF
jgi:hypothetical protein